MSTASALRRPDPLIIDFWMALDGGGFAPWPKDVFEFEIGTDYGPDYPMSIRVRAERLSGGTFRVERID